MSFRLCLLIGWLLTVLAACSAPPARPPGDPANAVDAKASSLLAEGNDALALARYQTLISEGQSPDHWRVAAADTALRLGDTRTAQETMAALRRDRLSAQDLDRLVLIESRIDLHQGAAREAFARLDSLADSRLPESDRINYRVLRISALNQLGDPRRAARERAALAPLLKTREEQDRNDQSLFAALKALPSEALKPQRGDEADFRAWLDLAVIFRKTPEPKQGSALAGWRAAHPDHPTRAPRLEALTGAGPATAPASDAEGPFLGVLLPLTGPHQRAGLAVRAGLLAAEAADERTEKRPLRFLDTAATPLLTLVQNAIKDGAQGFIGPLVKEDLAQLVALADLSLNTLALNEVQGPVPPSMVAFSLSPEAELDQLAAEIRIRGGRSAALILPATPFGQRLGQHFDASFRLKGGIILGQASFSPRGEGLGEIAKLLPALPEEAVVVLIADAEDAKAIVPNLRAEIRVPLYAASKIYDGRPDVASQATLHQVHFCDMPFLLDPLKADGERGQAGTEDAPDAQRLFAFGLDAYRLYPKLWPPGTGDPLLEGATGQLRLGRDHKIERQLTCARFDKTRLVIEGLAPLEADTLSRP